MAVHKAAAVLRNYPGLGRNDPGIDLGQCFPSWRFTSVHHVPSLQLPDPMLTIEEAGVFLE